MILFQQMLILFFLMLLGWWLARKGELDNKISGFLSMLIVKIANPCLVLSGCVNGNHMDQNTFLTTMGLAVGVYIVWILLAEAVIPLFFKEKKEQNVYKVMFIFSNMGFMGFPLISAMYGAESLLYASVFLLPFNLLLYTYGMRCMAGKTGDGKTVLKKCFNSGTIAGIAAIAISLCQIPVPDVAASIIEMLASLAAPLSMIVIGASLAEMNSKEAFGDVKLLIFSLAKLIIFPIAGFFLLRLVTKDIMLLGITLVILATPVGSMSAMLARQYGGDYSAASKGIAVTTLFSIVTMPLVFCILGL